MKRFKPEINSGSMADIAFLLLIFFLVATTIHQDKGLLRKLPTYQEPHEYPISKRNVLFVWLNSNNLLMVNDIITPVNELKEYVKLFVLNNGKKEYWSVSPQKAVISLKADEGSNYNSYLQIQNEIAKAYREMRNEMALKEFGLSSEQLGSETRAKALKIALPMNVSESFD